MSQKQAGVMLFEIEELLRRLQTFKKIPVKIIREERRLHQKLKVIFSKRFKIIMSRLKEEGIPSSDMGRRTLVSSIMEMKDEYAKTVIEETRAAREEGRRGIFNKLKKAGYLKEKKVKKARRKIIPKLPKPLPVIVEFSHFSEQVSRLIDKKTFEASVNTIARMNGDIMVNLKESYELGLGIDEAAQRLDDVFVSMSEFELERVARTEINQAQNRGAFETEKELEVDYHIWWTALDSRVRGTDPKDETDHVKLHGQIVKLGEPFENGLLFPGDTNGELSEFINCRCREIPFLMPEGFQAPPGVPYFYEEDLVPIK